MPKLPTAQEQLDALMQEQQRRTFIRETPGLPPAPPPRGQRRRFKALQDEQARRRSPEQQPSRALQNIRDVYSPQSTFGEFGLDASTIQSLRDAGVPEGSILELMLKAGGGLMSEGGRAIEGITRGLAGGAADIMEATTDQSPGMVDRFERDVQGLVDTGLTVGGLSPTRILPRLPRNVRKALINVVPKPVERSIRRGFELDEPIEELGIQPGLAEKLPGGNSVPVAWPRT